MDGECERRQGMFGKDGSCNLFSHTSTPRDAVDVDEQRNNRQASNVYAGDSRIAAGLQAALNVPTVRFVHNAPPGNIL